MDTGDSGRKTSDSSETGGIPSFGEWMRKRRKALDLTQDELARRSGCAKTTIRKLEADELKPSKELARALAEQLDVPAEERDSLVRFARSAAEPDKLPSVQVAELPWRRSARRSNNLPRQLTTFVGREHEVVEVKQLLAYSRLVTLTGLGGCGKTRLALQVAEGLQGEFQQRVWFVDLASLNDPELVAQRVATVLGVREESRLPLLDSLTDYLCGPRGLLVLDNCEHLVAACAQLAETLLRACAALNMLATSREALSIGGETIFQVPPLELPPTSVLRAPISNLEQYESVHLFIDRVRSVQPGFQISAANGSSIAQICIRLDGIPLAIELAAARTKQLTVEHIATRLEDRFNLLTMGSRVALPRQQTLRASMDWSYDLLSSKAQTLFRRLAVFVGSFTLKTAEAVCSDDVITPRIVLDELSRLVDQSMVLVEQQGEIENFRMLETIRQYAREKLEESQEAERLKQRHLWYCVDLAEEAEPKLTGTQQKLWFKRLEFEHDNLRGALAYALADDRNVEAGLRLAAALWRFWWLHVHWSEGREWLARFVSKGEGQGPSRALAKAINANGTLAFYQGDYNVARALFKESLRMRQRLDDREGIAASLNDLANVAYHSDGDYAVAQELYEASLAIRRELGDKWGTALCLSNIGLVAMAKQDYSEADRLQRASLAIFQELGDTWRTAYGLSVLGDLAWFRQDYALARTRQAESLELYQESEDKWGTASALYSLGEAERALHHYAEARRFYRESLLLSAELSSKFGIVYGIEGFAKLAMELGQVAQAARLFGMTEVLRNRIHVPRPPSERLEYDRLLAAARAQAGAGDWEAFWAEGGELTTDQAIELALGVSA